MTLAEVAGYLSMAERTIYEWAQSGRLPGFKLGSAWRFKRSEIEGWLEDQRSIPDEASQCAICSRTIGLSRPLGGECQSDECSVEICGVCWGIRNRRTCPIHADLERVASASAPSSGENVLAAQSLLGTRVLDGFVGRVEIRSHLVTEDGRELARVRNWGRAQKRREETIETPDVSVSDRRRGAPTGSLNCQSVEYTLGVTRGILETPHRSLKLIAIALQSSSPPARTRRIIPISIEQLYSLLNQHIDDARKANRHHILGLYSGTGWDDATKKIFGGDTEGERFMSSNLSLIGIGPDVGTALWNSNDPVTRELRHYFQATFEDEVAACRSTIRDEMTWSGVYLVSRLSDEHGYSASVARVAVESLERLGQIEINKDHGEDAIVSKGVE